MDNLIKENDELISKINLLEDKLVYLENQSRRSNIVINELWPILEDKVSQLIQNQLNINLNDCAIEQAHIGLDTKKQEQDL